jgi:dTDP-L-rhamnose 4-epimerase
MNEINDKNCTAETILITGGAGFIGSHTCDALISRGYRVKVLDILDPQIHGDDRVIPEWLDPAVDLIQGDVRSRDDLANALEGVDAVFHMAAQTGVGQSMYDIHSYSDINISGTAMLLDILANRPNRVKKLILSSSRAVYGEGAYNCSSCGDVHPPVRGRSALDDAKWSMFCPSCGGSLTPVPTNEEKPLTPISIYAETKRVQEELFRLYSSSYGLPVVILRYFNVYGSRQSLGNPYTGIGSIFITRALSGSPVSIYEDGQQGRDFVNVKDVVQANLLALENPAAEGGTFNVGSGERLTVLDLARCVFKELGISENLVFEGRFRVGDIRDCYAELAKSRSVLGYSPEISFSEGVGELVEWASGQKPMDRLAEAEAALINRNLSR